jgi:hypothetical protein
MRDYDQMVHTIDSVVSILALRLGEQAQRPVRPLELEDVIFVTAQSVIIHEEFLDLARKALPTSESLLART